MKIKTTKLQEMISKAIKGVGNNKLIPLTSLIALNVSDNKLTITSTDATNYLYITSDINSDDFYVCVQADQFSKLITRMTCDEVSLEVINDNLEIKGNGTYTIALPLDEDGTMVKYPNPAESLKGETIGTVKLATITSILNSIKPGLATTMEFPQYVNYYVGDCVVATDTFKLNSLNTNLFSVPKLISGEMMNLLEVVTADTITVIADDNKIMFKTDDCVVYGTTASNIDDFSIDRLQEIIQQEFTSSCKLAKTSLLQLLDRISLFVDTFDEGAVTLNFTKDGLLVSSKKSNGTELIPYIESNNFADFVGIADIIGLQTQIKAQASDTIELQYGLDTALKFVDGDSVSILALLTD